MALLLATWLVHAAYLYLALGLLLLPWWHWRGLRRLDTGAGAGPWGFRVLITPGLIALWPWLLARAGAEDGYKRHGVTTQLLDLASLPPEIFAPTSYTEKPATFSNFTDSILAPDGLVVVTPEYNGGAPGILKYFIDMLPFPESFEARPICFVGVAAGILGALRRVEQLRTIFGYRNAHIFPERVFIPGVRKMLDAAEGFANTDMEKQLDLQAAGFVSFIEKLRGTKP